MPMLLSGCDNPFNNGNSIGTGSGFDQVNPGNPTPGGSGSSGGSNSGGSNEEVVVTPTMYNPYNYEKKDNPFDEIGDSIGYVKSIYKKSAGSLSSGEITTRRNAYTAAAEQILTRLAGEYGITDGLQTINPLSNVSKTTFRSVGLLSSGYTATQSDMDAVADAFMTAQYIKTSSIAGSMQYAMVSTSSFPSNPIVLNYSEGKVTLNTSGISKLELVFANGSGIKDLSEVKIGYEINDTDAFYKITLTGNPAKVVYLIYSNTFINNFGTNYKRILDTHRDSIRYNIVSLNDSAVSASDTLYSLTTKSWAMTVNASANVTNYLSEFKKHSKTVGIELASVMTFGLNDDAELSLPTSSAGAYYSGNIDEFYEAAKANTGLYDSYMNFCVSYIEHSGFVPYEADAISEYLAKCIIGAEVLSLDETRYTQNAFINTTDITKTFNSNEEGLNSDDQVIYRKLIADYNNTKTRAFEKNSVFKTINYAKTITDYAGAASGSQYVIDGVYKSDSRNALFKNYYNTMYSACYGIVTDVAEDISLMSCDIDYSYLQNVTISEEGEDEEEEDTGEEGEEEEENYILDTELRGKLQSMIIFPMKAMDIRYMEIGVEAVLADGDKLEISLDLRYHKGGQVYYVEDAFVPDGGGVAELTSEENVINFEFCSAMEIGNGLMFKDSSNNLVKEKLLSFDNCIPKKSRPDLRKSKWSLIPWGHFPDGPGKKDVDSGFTFNPYSSSMGANYVYTDTSYDFIEVCFNVKPKYKNFDTNYQINGKVTSVYGNLR